MLWTELTSIGPEQSPDLKRKQTSKETIGCRLCALRPTLSSWPEGLCRLTFVMYIVRVRPKVMHLSISSRLYTALKYLCDILIVPVK